MIISSKDAVADNAGKKTNEEPANEGERNGQEKDRGASNKEDDQNVQDFRVALENLLVQLKKGYLNSTNRDSTVSPSVSTVGQSFTNVDDLPTDPLMPDLEDTGDLLNTGIFSGAYNDEDVGTEVDLNKLETTMNVSHIPTTRIHKDHLKDQIIRDINLATQTRRMTKISEELAMMEVKSAFLYGTIEEEVSCREMMESSSAKIKAEDVDVHLYRSMIGSLLGLKDLKMILRVTTTQEVIKNGNKVLKRTVGETEQEYEPATAEEKQDRRNEIKSRGTLLMALPNKDQLKFHSYKDAKLLMDAIEKRYGGNKESKKVQRTLLKQQYKNFARSSSETMDQTFDSNSSTNEADNSAYGVSAAHTQSNPTTRDNLSNVMICAFLASQPNSPQILEIHQEDRKLDVNGQRVGFDRSKVECYNCHKYGQFTRECKAPRNQENRGIKINKRTVTVETPTENALVAQDGIGGYDWSYQAEEEHPTNFALMAHTSSGSSSSSDSEVDSCSKSCVKAYATLKEQYDSLSSDYKRSQFNLVSYKAGLESVEARLAHYKKNEVVYEESINVLNLEVKLRDNALVENKKKLEKAEKERDELKLTLEKFQNSSKSLNNLLESQVIDKFKTGLGYNAAYSTAASPAVESFVNSSKMLENQEYNNSKFDKGYHAVPPPFTGNFMPRKPDLTFIDEIVKIEPKTIRKNSFRPPVIKDDESEVEIIPKDKIGNPQQKEYKEKRVIDNGCSWNMTGNKCYLTEYEDYDGGFVSFRDGKRRILGK
ncbi:ribonuclease H-like domain-containing protein, partial [Tanacetum coccineum]